MVKSNKSTRNGIISILKFASAITILLYHASKMLGGSHKYQIAETGYIVVDLFFIISGYYLYYSTKKRKVAEKYIYKVNVENSIKKFKMYLPYTVFIGIATNILLYFNKLILKDGVLMSIFNIFLFDMSGVSGYTVNGPTWYLSALIIISFIIYPLICKYKEKYTYYIAPLIVIFGLGYIYKSFPSLNIFLTGWNGFFYNGLIRALVDMNMGILVFEIAAKLKNNIDNIPKLKKKMVSLIHIALYAFIIYFIYVYMETEKIDYFVYVIIVLALILSFANTNLSSKLDTKIVNYLEKISFPIFINHFFFINLFNLINSKNKCSFTVMLVVYTISTLIVSIAEYHIISLIKKKIKKSNFTDKKKIKKK